MEEPADAKLAEGVVETVIEAPGWSAAMPDLAAAAEAAARLALEADGRAPEGYTLALLACDDGRIADLNAAFRGKPAPTNVLSWPAFPGAPPQTTPPPAPSDARDDPPIFLGDVAIALQTTEAEARAAGLDLKDHTIHLILHACLHLLGYDHQSEADADRMEGIETAALAKLGIADPYSRGDAAHPHPD